jgi:hypothetical protein
MASTVRWADDQVHNDELSDVGPAIIRGQIIDAVRLYHIDYEKLEARNIGYIRENIAVRKKREERENRDAAGN